MWIVLSDIDWIIVTKFAVSNNNDGYLLKTVVFGLSLLPFLNLWEIDGFCCENLSSGISYF
jgi:hypothetical protein